MTAESENPRLETIPTKSPRPETHKDSVERDFRWLLKALLVWVAVELTVGVPFFFLRKTASAAIGCVMAITYLMDLYLLRRGRFRAASWTFISVTWLVCFVVTVFRGGMGSQFMVFLLAICIVAGWLLGDRSMLCFLGLALLSTLALALLQTFGFQLPNYFSQRHPLAMWLLFTFSLMMAVVPLRHILKSLHQLLRTVRDSEERHRALIHSIDGILWEADAQTLRFQFVSQSAERILGYPVEGWLGDPAFWENHLHTEDRDQVLYLCGAAGQALGDFEFRCRMIAADGRVVWLHTKIQVVAERGGAAKLRGIMMDVSRYAEGEIERKRAEEALRQREEELSEAQRVAHVGSWVWDPHDDTVSWSQQLYRIAGRDPSQPPPAYEEQMQLYTPESWTQLKRAVDEALRHGTPYKLDLEMVRPDGGRRWITSRGEAIRDETGRIIGLRGTAQDITERKKAEEALRLFRTLIDQSNDAIEVVDPDTLRFLDVNERACLDHGYSRDELLSMSVFDINPSIRSVSAKINADLEKSGFALIESVHRRKDGTTYPVEVAVTSIRLDRKYHVAVVRDTTQRKKAEEALRQQEAKVRGLFQLAKTLTGTLDLPTILDLLNFQSIHLIGAEAGCAGLRTDNGVACDSYFQEGVRQEMHFTWPPGVGIPGRVLETKKTYLTNDAEHELLIPAEMRESMGLRSVLCVPVLDVQEEVIAFFALHNKEAGDFGANDVETVEGIAQVASIAIQNAQAYQKIQQAEVDLRRLSARLINSQDQERQRIAHELHETTAQDLAALRMSLGTIERVTSNLSTPAQEAIKEALQLSDQLIGAVRTLSYVLHPPLLELTGLTSTVNWYAAGFSKRSGIEVKVEFADDLGRLPRDYETTLFRIIQECLMNVHNHSGSRQAQIRIARENGDILMEVQDHGKGIAGWSDRGPMPGTLIGVGIAGMRERVRQFKGTLEIKSAREHGTTVRVILPVTNIARRMKHARPCDEKDLSNPHRG